MTSEFKFSKSVLKVTIVTIALLLIPFISMQFSGEVNWTLTDFIFAGVMIFGTGFAYLFITRNAKTLSYRVAIGFALFTGFVMIWTNLAVGIIGSETNFINLLYFAIIITGVIGSVVSRFQIHGMTLSMFSCAIGIGIITVIAFVTGMHNIPGSSITEVLAVNGLFVSLFLVSGFLFRYAKG